MPINKLSSNASLREVMDKFEEISFQDFSSLDIVVKTELPKTVKNGQYVIIDSNTNLGVVSSYFTEDEDTNKIFIYLYERILFIPILIAAIISTYYYLLR